MTAPGTIIQTVTAAPPTTIPTATDPWFVAGFTEKGVPATEALTPCRSLNDFVNRFGQRLTYSVLYDSAEAYFAEGGTRLYVARVTGPAPTGDLSTPAGVDDHVNATDATWATAINLFPADLGPGQVSMPGRTTTQSYTDQLTHAQNNNRVAILDGVDTATATTLTTATAGLKGLTNARRGGLFAPWAVIPGITPGTTRTIPYSAIQAGLIARSDGAGNDPNIPAAGDNGVSRVAIGLSQVAWDDTTRDTLNQAGVNVARNIYGTVRTYGYRTLADPTISTTWLQLSSIRLYMAVKAQLNATAEQFVFDQIDGRGQKFAEFGGALTATLLPFWRDGALYGNSPADAFVVDVSAAVNTPTTIANGELHASVGIRISPFAELVYVNVAKVPITQALS